MFQNLFGPGNHRDHDRSAQDDRDDAKRKEDELVLSQSHGFQPRSQGFLEQHFCPDKCEHQGQADVQVTEHPQQTREQEIQGSQAEDRKDIGCVDDKGIIRNAVNLPALSADQYRRVRPYLELAERLGSLERYA